MNAMETVVDDEEAMGSLHNREEIRAKINHSSSAAIPMSCC